MEQFKGKKGIYTKREETLKNFDAICNCEAADLSEQAFLYVGGLDDVRARAKEMAKQLIAASALTGPRIDEQEGNVVRTIPRDIEYIANSNLSVRLNINAPESQ